MTRHVRFVLLAVLLVIVLSLCIGVLIARADCSGYVVQPGDTLYRIARANGTTWQELARVNGLTSPDRIYIGQCLLLGVEQISSVKGLAMADWGHSEDLLSLNVAWYYGWGEYCTGDARCINMVRNMQLPQTCYTVLLVGNEPNAVEPYGAPVSPGEAAKKIKAIEAQCPATKLIVGNVSADDWGNGNGAEWLKAFLREYKRLTCRVYSQTLGVHCYQIQSGWCIGQLAAMRRVYSGEMWLTEYNDLSGDVNNFVALTDYAFANFSGVALYTNRQPDAPWALNGASVIMPDGSLDARGVYYAQR